MANAFLNNGATSLAAANWSDATGFGATANTAELTVGEGNANIVDDVDQSAATGHDVVYFVVEEGFTGTLGKAGTPVQFEAATPSNARVEYRAGGGAFYASPSGTGWDTLILNTSGQMYIEGGTVASLEVTRCPLVNIGASAVITNAKLGGGGGTIEYNSTGFTSCDIYSGTWIIKREGTFTINGDARVTFDIPETNPTMDVKQHSHLSRLHLKRCEVIATMEHNAGYQGTVGVGERPTSIGSTAYTLGPASLAVRAFRDVDTLDETTNFTRWGGQLSQIGRVPAF